MDQHRDGDHDSGADNHRPLLHREGEVPQAARGLLRFLTHVTAARLGVLVLHADHARDPLQPDDLEGQATSVLHHRVILRLDGRSRSSMEQEFRRAL
ncbi:hypothetical protein KM043_007570 [Ampulex compressa]|nr:hypothetical protein KM043_007570 [Ampulex compressa]